MRVTATELPIGRRPFYTRLDQLLREPGSTNSLKPSAPTSPFPAAVHRLIEGGDFERGIRVAKIDNAGIMILRSPTMQMRRSVA